MLFDDKLEEFRNKLQEAIALGADVQRDILTREDGAMEYSQGYREKILSTVMELATLRNRLD